MKIARIHSHLNGLEFLEARRPELWQEIESVIGSVDANVCKTKQSLEKRKGGKFVFSPGDLNKSFEKAFETRGWAEGTVQYFVCEDAETNRRAMDLDPPAQKAAIQAAGFVPFPSRNQTDFVKDRVAVEVQFGKYAFVAYDLFVKHLAFYVRGVIDVGVEIIPMKALQNEMSSGPAYFEGELYNLIRGGRGVPPVPLVLIGLDV